MNEIRYSPTTGGFYRVGVHAEIPADAVAVSADRHAQLMRAQQEGARIAPGRGGRPISVGARPLQLDDLRRAAIDRVDAAARARILTIASPAQQSNDNAALAIGALTGELSDTAATALDRRRRIEDVRTAAARLKARIAESSADELNLMAADDAMHWPQEI